MERSGGIMGSVSSRTIDTEKLSKSQATELKDLLTHSDFFKLSSLRSNVGSQKGAADYYTYNITVEDGEKKHSVKCTDIAMTKELRQLISSLSKVKE
ncbi:MAG: protealysin inhibitor emfourin [Nitrososphaeraceae archaeon]